MAFYPDRILHENTCYRARIYRKIVEAMRAEGITKEDIGRDKFLERAWDWKEKYGGRIIEQLKKMGSSCDWDRASSSFSPVSLTV